MTQREQSFDVTAYIKARCVEVGDCWEWQGAFSGPQRRNVPCMRLPGALDPKRPAVTVHRYLYEQSKPVKEGYIVWRHCCNPACVNPDHLRSGARAQFAQAMKKAGKYEASMLRKARATAARRQQPTKIDIDIARRIRAEQGQRRAQDIAHEVGIDKSQVWRIWRGEAWKEAANSIFGMLA